MDTKKLKILCLHGNRQNKDVFREKLGQFRKYLKQYAEFHFINAPHSIVNKTVNENAAENNCTPADERGWWIKSEDTDQPNSCVGLEDSINLVEKTVSEDGPFDGILGFSQGAALTAIICSLIETKSISFTIDFVIIVAGYKSPYDEHADVYTDIINITSLHVIGDNDKVIHPDRSRALVSMFSNSKVLTHPGGHYVPASKELKDKYIDFLKSVMKI